MSDIENSPSGENSPSDSSGRREDQSASEEHVSNLTALALERGLTPAELTTLKTTLEEKRFQRQRAHYGLEELLEMANNLPSLQSKPSSLNRRIGRISEILRKLAEDLSELTTEIDSTIRILGPRFDEENPRTNYYDMVISEIESALEEQRNWLSSTNMALFRTLSVSTLPPCVQPEGEEPTMYESTPTHVQNQQHDSIVFREDFMHNDSIVRAAETRNEENANRRRAAESDQQHQQPSTSGPAPATTSAQPQLIVNEPHPQQTPFQTIGEFREKYAQQDMNVKLTARTPVDYSTVHESENVHGATPLPGARDAADPRFLTHTVVRNQPAQLTVPIQPTLAATPSQMPIPLGPHQLTMPSTASSQQYHGSQQTSATAAAAATTGGTFEYPTYNGMRPFSTQPEPFTLGRGAREVPKFDGDVRNYRQWQKMFEIFVDNTPAPTFEKYNILRKTLTGRAFKAIQYLPWEDCSYEIAKSILHRKFGNSDHARDAHRDEINRILDRGAVQEHKLTAFVDALSLNIRALIGLGSSYIELSMVVPKIKLCLPPDMRLKYVEWLRAREPSSDTELEKLMEFLDYSLELRAQAGYPSSSKNPQNKGNNSKRDGEHQQANKFHGHNLLTQSATPANTKPQKEQSKKTNKSCVFCGETHETFKCKKTLTHEERCEKIKEQNACMKCLKRNHLAKDCKGGPSRECPNCKGKHYSIMCKKSQLDGATFHIAQADNNQPSGNASPILLRTARVWVESENARELVRIILDPGAQHSYIRASTAKAIASKPVGAIRSTVKTMGNVVKTSDTVMHRIVLRSQHDPKKWVNVECIETDEITDSALPTVNQEVQLNPVADEPKGDDAPLDISLLIGADALAAIHTGTELTSSRMLATSTIFGWVFCGPYANPKAGINSLNLLCEIRSVLPVQPKPPQEDQFLTAPHEGASLGKRIPAKKDPLTESDLKFLWELEFMGLNSAAEPEKDVLVEELNKFFDASIVQSADGRYSLSLPFKDNVTDLPDNAKMALSRLYAFIKKLSKNQVRLAAVDDEIQRSIERGYAEIAAPKQPGQIAHYLPLQAVFKTSPDGSRIIKTRVVKDASARKSHEPALNDVLHIGENLLPQIPNVLCAFRGYRYAACADIEQAFHQFEISPSNRSVLRFFWPLGISKNPNAPVKEFWTRVLDFGLSCSPWLHIKGVRHHLMNCKSYFPAYGEFLQEVSNNIYMDDISLGGDSRDEIKQRINVLFEAFQMAKFPLRKWSASDPEIASFILDVSPLDDISVTSNDDEAKFLGVQWLQSTDKVGVFTQKALDELSAPKPTKRSLLRALASIFDPIGILCPTTVKAKIIFQSLWKRNIDWDDPLPSDIQVEYDGFVQQLKRNKSLTIDRCLSSFRAGGRYEMHTFTDASMEAYGCITYLRSVYADSVETTLVMAKARVAPIKHKWSIHRYELMACLQGARLTANIIGALKVNISEQYFWVDNMACIAWIRGEPERFPAFVSNRVREIQKLVSPSAFYYVKSEQNPADILSRGTDTSDDETKKLWIHGPEFLNRLEKLPTDRSTPEGETEEESTQETQCLLTVRHPTADNAVDQLLSAERFSSWHKLLRAQAFCNRLREHARAARLRVIDRGSRNSPRVSPARQKNKTLLQPSEYAQAEIDLIRRLQRRWFPVESANGCSSVPKNNQLAQYSPYVGSDGLIRCRTRLEKSEEHTRDEKSPIIISDEGGWAKLLIIWIHAKKCWHWGGTSATLHRIRERFFVFRVRKLTNEALRACRGCQRFNAKPAVQPTPPLPDWRIEETPPFLFTGVDFFGPVYYKTEDDISKRSPVKKKSWVLLMTCAVTRAIHLELTTDQSTYEVLRALQKFINRFPSARNFVSDNGASFRRADKELKLLYGNIMRGDIAKWSSEAQITWRFITPAAPWTGGFYERLVSCVKRCLRKILGSSTPYFRDLEVVLSGAEAVINRRPLTTVSTDPNEIKALSPANLLYGIEGDTQLPETNEKPLKKADIGAVVYSKRWIYQQRILRSFWRRFHSEYLAYLRSAHSRKPVDERKLNVGDVCILKEDKPSRAHWKLVRISRLHPADNLDGRNRTCTITTASGQTLQRAVRLLYPLEAENPDQHH